MPARTGEQFLKGLRGPRAVWVDGDYVSRFGDLQFIDEYGAGLADRVQPRRGS